MKQVELRPKSRAESGRDMHHLHRHTISVRRKIGAGDEGKIGIGAFCHQPFLSTHQHLGGASSFCASKAPPYMGQLEKRQGLDRQQDGRDQKPPRQDNFQGFVTDRVACFICIYFVTSMLVMLMIEYNTSFSGLFEDLDTPQKYLHHNHHCHNVDGFWSFVPVMHCWW